MPLTLHHAWRSSASRRVRLCLEEKNLPYESKVVNMEAMEHHSPEYLKFNPNGVVPTLIHDGRPLHKSGTICEYLDECFPEPPLRPQDPYERANMRNWIRHADERIGNLIIFYWVHGLAKTAQKWSDEERAAARGKLVQMVDRMEEELAKTGWLAGDRYSLADIALVPFVKRIEEEIAPEAVTKARHPRGTAWWTTIQGRPAYERARIGPFV